MEAYKEKTYDTTDYYGGLNFDMQKIEMCLSTLITSIKEGETYKKYQFCEEKLKEQPELRERVNEFRKAVFQLNNDESDENLFEKVDAFENKYQEFRKIPMVNEYLEAELDMCRLMQKVQREIHEAVEISIPLA